MKNIYRKKVLLITIILLSQVAFSQKLEVEFGKISQEEIGMKSYENDKKAKAVVLFDIGKSLFFESNNGYDIRFTKHKRTKIFDKSASQYAVVSIPFYIDGDGKSETVVSIEAVTYNFSNGSIIQKKLDPSTVYQEQISERWYNKKFIFPDVQDGSILEYRYVLETPFQFNLPDWIFQDKIPTVYSEYQVSMIPFYEYKFIAQGITKFSYHNTALGEGKRSWGSVVKSFGQNVSTGIEFQDNIHTYVMKNVPAFVDESYISSINDYIIKMDFQLAKVNNPGGGTIDIMSTWSALNESLIKHEEFGKYLKNSSKNAKKVITEELKLEGKESRQKAKEIIEYVKTNFEWNGYDNKYASQSPKDFFTKKKGNSADINLFMLALLNEAEINAKPVILSTRDHGKIPSDYPFDHFTNYVIALINVDSPFLADGTEELLTYDRLPTRCNNDKGLVVDNEELLKWIHLNNNTLSIDKSNIMIKFDSVTMDAITQVSIQSTEYEAFKARNKFKNDTLKIKEYYKDAIGDIKKVKTLGYDNLKYPYSINFVSNNEPEKLAGTIVIKPFLNLPLSKNELTQNERTYPVDFIYPWEKKFESIIEIPSGYYVSGFTNDYKVDNELTEININHSIEGNILKVSGNYKFKKSSYVNSEYTQIKSLFDQIIKIFNQHIVLEKRK